MSHESFWKMYFYYHLSSEVCFNEYNLSIHTIKNFLSATLAIPFFALARKCKHKIGFSQFSLENGNLHQKNGNLPLQKYFSWFFFYCIIIWFCNLKRKYFASAAKILPMPASNLAIHLGIYVNICLLTQIARVALITKISHPFVGIFVNTAFIL